MYSDTRKLISLQNPAVLVVAHRGVWTRAPENSLSALDEAISSGADIIEVDTQTTADHQLVVIHDAWLDRTCDHQGEVARMPFSEVRRARLRGSDGRAGMVVTEERVPLLEALLEEARGRIVVNIDIKFERDRQRVMDLILDMNMADGVLLKSKIDLTTQTFPLDMTDSQRRIPFMPIVTTQSGSFAEELRKIEDFGAQIVELNFTDLVDVISAKEELQRLGIRLWVNTLDEAHPLDYCDSRAYPHPAEVWGELVKAGFGAIQTDSVSQLRRWLKDKGR